MDTTDPASQHTSPLDGIAIIGMAGRFPGAEDVETFWQNLAAGVESITRFTDEELRAAGYDPAELARDGDFVPARSVLKNVAEFDAAFFGIDPREAELLDPQHRVFLETAWTALENAGCDTARYPGAVGLFAGLSLNTYLLANILADRAAAERISRAYQIDEFATILGNDKDFLTTRVAYKLNLRGPAMTVQCACSTSLVAVAQACQSLQTFGCDMALAGAVSITFPQTRGYKYQEGAMGSADGHCRTFDADARGTVFGDGCGIVVLKRLADALADGDHVSAVIRAAALNNDGSGKVSYTAPSVEGQAEVIALAHALADVDPETISYVEAHGTATPLGDPIEVAALTQAFRARTDKKQFCALGSAKTNFGHLDVASGVTGLIKTALALKHRAIPPSLHFQKPNPEIDFASSPFFVNTKLTEWKNENGAPLRAGVSSFGVGGTNAHLVLEEAPPVAESEPERGPHLFILSAKTATALEAAADRLADFLEKHPSANLADVAWTLQTGRRAFEHRRILFALTAADAAAALRSEDSARAFSRKVSPRDPAPVTGGESAADLAQRWLRGENVDWSPLHAGKNRRRVALPTYAFDRKRFWIEPPARATAPAAVAPSEMSEPESAAIGTPELPPVHRREAILGEVKAVLRDLSGQDLSAVDTAASFFDLGFDSLFLTQVGQGLRSKFGVKITFRQLLGEVSTLGAVVDFLDAQLPPEKFAPAPVTKSASPAKQAPGPLPTDSPLDAMSRQLAEIARQLEALRNPAPTVSAETKSPAPQSEPRRFGPYKPIDKTAAPSGFTPQKQAHLDALIARYTAKTPKSKALTAKHRARFADPRAVSGFRPFWKEMVYPIVAGRSAGSRIWDLDGNEYVDVTMGFGTNLLGHSPQFVTDALEAQLKLGVEVGPSSPIAGEVAEMFCELTGAERVTFCSTGSEATLCAIRLARTVTGRTKIATMSEAYHGINDEVLVRAAGDRPMPVAPGIPPHAVSEVVVLDWTDPQAALALLKKHAHELACVLVETVQSRRPEIQPVEFLREVRRITAESGTALVFDEVITGFRVHPGGAQALWDIKPDMSAYGKVIGGGMPIGALAGRAEYLDALDGGAWSYGDDSFPEVGVTFFAGTYVRHPLAMAAAKAVFTHLKNEGPKLQRDLSARVEKFVGELNAFFKTERAGITVTHFASMMYFHFDAEVLRHPSLLFFHLREKGVHIWEGRPWFLSTAHTDADIAFITAAFQESVRELRAGGFLANVPALPLHAPACEPHTAERALPTRECAPHTAECGRDTHERAAHTGGRAARFSLYFFGSDPADRVSEKYALISDAAKFGDTHGFEAVWLPERHFHPVGGFSPNPSLLAASLARETSRIKLRAGSVVIPLHHPIRIAEEWAIVDNLSGGRAGLSFASGWHPNDFVFAPENFEKRRQLYADGMELIRKFWRGEPVSVTGGAGNALEVTLHPLPKQRELPFWMTCQHRDSFVKAGELGAGVLAHTVNDTVEGLAEKFAAYRESLAAHGHPPERAHVTLLVHTFLADDAEAAVEKARAPFYEYLSSFLDNGKKKIASEGRKIEVADEDMREILAVSYEDYVTNKAFIGSPDSCVAIAEKLAGIGVDEFACFVDFGVDAGAVLASLEKVNVLREKLAARAAESAGPAVLPLTEAGQGLWALATMSDAASRVYNESLTLILRGPLDAGALARSVQKLVDRHEALRVSVGEDGDVQTVLPRVSIEVPVHDFSGEVNGTRDARVGEFLARHEREPFDLTKPPAVRAALLKLEAAHHLLALTFHHLLGNGPSYYVFIEELAAIYEAELHGRPAALPRAMSFREAVAWQVAQTRDLAASEAFWLEQFAGGVPALEMPADRPRPAVQSFAGNRVAITLDAAFTRELKAAAAGQRCSLFMLLFSAYAVLLHRLSGQEDVVIGVPFEGEIRTLEGGGSLYANTTHMTPLRSRVPMDAAFADCLAQTKQLVLDGSEHQDYFFGRLLKKLNLPRDPGRSPLFSATFNFETGEWHRSAGGLDWTFATEGLPYRGPAGSAMFELYLNVAERGGELICQLDHADFYAPERARRWLEQFRALLGDAIRRPRAAISELSMGGESEAVGAAAQAGAEQGENIPGGALLHGLFEAQAARTPDAVAVCFENETLTYAALNMRANQLARHLQKLGVGRDVLAGIAMERSCEMVVAMLAVLKAGGAYVPLDPGYPAERLTHMIADAQMPVILTQSRIAASLPENTAHLLHVDTENFTGESDANLAVETRPEDLAYVIYTSGSTGAPKGVMIPHAAICNHMTWIQEEFPLTAEDRVLQKTPISFDASVWEFYAPLLAGAQLVLARPGAQKDSRELAEAAARGGITILQLVPSMLALVAEENALADCSKLRRVFAGGEVLAADLCGKFFARLPGCELVNLYGPTECAIDATFHRCARGEKLVPIGKPVANTRLFILDEAGNPQPQGVAGELCIGGAQLARGYWRNPELTAVKFITFQNERVYKTGDLARWLPGGEVEFLGRADDQVKIRGHRIELGEIESVLARQPGVAESAVAVHEDASGTRRLVAYVARKKTGEVELWPSSPSAGGEQFFDDILYTAMSNDAARNACFTQAFEMGVRGKVVVDIGTGKDAILARLAAEAGARKVYAIELLPKAARQARELVEKLGLGQTIVVIEGDASVLELPEKADVCISENLGHVGGAEGWDLILEKSRHLLKPGAAMIPARCETRVAAVAMPREFLENPGFAELAAYYAENLWKQAGYPFDLRLSVTGTGRANLRSDSGTFEMLDFTAPAASEAESRLRLRITQGGRIDGFLLWLKVEVAPGIIFETLENQDSWLPVYLPAFYPGIEVAEGDEIRASVRSTLAKNGRNRDYVVRGVIAGKNGGSREFEYRSAHYEQVYKQTAFYQRLFANDRIEAVSRGGNLMAALKAALPEAMQPSAIVTLPALPRTPGGKLDRRALPPPDFGSPGVAAGFAAPRTALEKKVAEIWQTVLGVERIGVNDNFFDLGGDSLLGLRIVNRLRDLLGERVSLIVIFEAPTIAALAAVLEKHYGEAARALGGGESAGGEARAAGRIGEAHFEKFRRLVRPMAPCEPGGEKNPRAIFVLSAMRSGSTLLRVMLAGHGRLFAPPELELLQFETLAERAAAISGPDESVREGTIRALREAHGCGAEESARMMEEMTREGCTVREFYGRLQGQIAPRMLVDKTPDYALSRAVLERAEVYFDRPIFIHLTRHPLGMARSYEKGRFILEWPFRGQHDFTARELAELMWAESNRNILAFLENIPAGRQHRLRFENLVAEPRAEMERLCRFLELDFEPEMLRPYGDASAKMTDGAFPMSGQVGDPNFRNHQQINATVAEQWRSDYAEDFLSPETWLLAAELGYENPFQPDGGAAAPAVQRSAAQPIARMSREARRVARAAL